MYTLVKLGFWFGLVLFFMPLGNGSAETAPQVSAVQAIYAAKDAVEDVRGMTAREGARMAFNYLDARYGEPELAVVGPVPQEEVPAAGPAE